MVQKMARWTNEWRQKARTKVLTKLEEGKSFADACMRSNVSEVTVKRWVKEDPAFGSRFEAAKKAGAPLRPKSNAWRNYESRRL